MDDLKSPVIKEFTLAATAFCQALEEGLSSRTSEMLVKFQQSLPMLYLKGSQLPRLKYCYEEEPKRFVREEDYERIFDTLQQKISQYTGVFIPEPGAGPGRIESMSVSMAEGIADLYEAMKNYIKLYEIGITQAMNDAVWICRHDFEENLGIKIIDNLRSIHQLVYKSEGMGRVAAQGDDPEAGTEEEPWYLDEQEQVYGEDE